MKKILVFVTCSLIFSCIPPEEKYDSSFVASVFEQELAILAKDCDLTVYVEKSYDHDTFSYVKPNEYYNIRFVEYDKVEIDGVHIVKLGNFLDQLTDKGMIKGTTNVTINNNCGPNENWQAFCSLEIHLENKIIDNVEKEFICAYLSRCAVFNKVLEKGSVPSHYSKLLETFKLDLWSFYRNGNWNSGQMLKFCSIRG
jgi:hypothetical protein